MGMKKSGPKMGKCGLGAFSGQFIMSKWGNFVPL